MILHHFQQLIHTGQNESMLMSATNNLMGFLYCYGGFFPPASVLMSIHQRSLFSVCFYCLPRFPSFSLPVFVFPSSLLSFCSLSSPPVSHFLPLPLAQPITAERVTWHSGVAIDSIFLWVFLWVLHSIFWLAPQISILTNSLITDTNRPVYDN